MNRLVAGIGVVALLSSCTGDKALCAADEEMDPYTGECEPERSSGGSSADDGGGEPDGEDSGSTGDDTGAAGDGRGALPEGAAYATVGLGRELWPEEDGKLDCDEVELSLAGERGLLMAWSGSDELVSVGVVEAGSRACDATLETSAVALAYMAGGGMLSSPATGARLHTQLLARDEEVAAVVDQIEAAGGLVSALEDDEGSVLAARLAALLEAAGVGGDGPPPPPAASVDGAFDGVDYQLLGAVDDTSDSLSLSAQLTDAAAQEFVLLAVDGEPALWLVPDGVPTHLAAGVAYISLGVTPSLYTAGTTGTATVALDGLHDRGETELPVVVARPAVVGSAWHPDLQDLVGHAQMAAMWELVLTFGLSSADIPLLGDPDCVEEIAGDVLVSAATLFEEVSSGSLSSAGELLAAVLFAAVDLLEDATVGGEGGPSWAVACDLDDPEAAARVVEFLGRFAFFLDAASVVWEFSELESALFGGVASEEATHSICPFADCDAGDCGWRGDDLVCSDELFCDGELSDVSVDGTVVSFTGSVTCDVAIDTLTVKLGDTATLWSTSPGTTSVSFSQAVDTASADVTGDTALGLWARPSGAEAERVATADIHIDGACSDSGARTCISGDVWRVDDCGEKLGSDADVTCLDSEECLESGDTAWCSPVDTGCDDSGATTCISGDVWRVDDCGDVVGSRADVTCLSTEECVDYGTYAECVTVEEPGEPNLDPGTLSLSPDSGHAGRITMAYVDLTNEGDADAGSVEYGFYWSSDTSFSSGDEELYTGSTSLDAGETVSLDRGITLPDDADEGRGYVLFVADPDDRIDESSESDNVAWDAFDVEAPEDDAEAWSVTITESSADPGDDISISTRVYNRGTEEITFTWAIYWSDNSTWSTADTLLYEETSTISAGRFDSYIDTVTVPSSADDGTGYVFLIADPDDELAESDEDNNEAKDSITIR